MTHAKTEGDDTETMVELITMMRQDNDALRAQVDRLTAGLGYTDYYEQIVDLRAHIAELEKALIEIAAMDDCYPDVMKHLARSTLAAKDNQ
jgi:hypothetical protein